MRFLTHPVVSSLLMTIGMLGLLVEIRTPGFALPGTIGLLSLGLFFWGHWLVQLAGWEEVLLAAGKVAIMIPFPLAADDHQRKNAEALQTAGAAAIFSAAA